MGHKLISGVKVMTLYTSIIHHPFHFFRTAAEEIFYNIFVCQSYSSIWQIYLFYIMFTPTISTILLKINYFFHFKTDAEMLWWMAQMVQPFKNIEVETDSEP